MDRGKLLWNESKPSSISGINTVDHSLQFILEKYISSKDVMLAVTFMDLRSLTQSLSRDYRVNKEIVY